MPRVIEIDRLLLRPWVEADAVLYRDLWAERDPRSLRVIDAAGRPTVEDLREKIRTELTEPDPTGLRLLVIERRAEKDFIGYCGLIHRDMTPEEPEIAYELLRRAHGCGYATQAAGGMLGASLAGPDCGLESAGGTRPRSGSSTRSDSRRPAWSMRIQTTETWCG